MRSGESNGSTPSEVGATNDNPGSSMRDRGSMRPVRAERRSRPCSMTVPAWTSNAVTGSSGHSERGSSARTTSSASSTSSRGLEPPVLRARTTAEGESVDPGAARRSATPRPASTWSAPRSLSHNVARRRNHFGPATGRTTDPVVSGAVRTRPVHTTSVNTVPTADAPQQTHTQNSGSHPSARPTTTRSNGPSRTVPANSSAVAKPSRRAMRSIRLDCGTWRSGSRSGGGVSLSSALISGTSSSSTSVLKPLERSAVSPVDGGVGDIHQSSMGKR